MTDLPAEVVDLLLAGSQLPPEFKHVRLIPPLPVPNIPHPVTHSLEESDDE